ncbi:MAG TPA: ABC transporter permease, partial [Thermoanaerobaculia bacterium]
MRSLLQDLRYAARTLSKSPGFTAVAVATLALGIGANTLVFSLFESLLLRPFPFPNLDRLVTVWEEPPAHGGGPQVHRRPLSPGDFLDLRREATSFEKTAAFRYRDFRLTAVAEAADVRGVSVDQGFFETLGARPTTGVAFGPTDFEPGRDRVAIVSEAFWRRELGTDPGVLSRELLLDGERYAIRGVMPADFHYPLGSVEIWTPLAFRNAEESERSVSDLVVVARLKKSLGLVAARAEVGAIARRLERRYPRSNTGRRLTLLPLREEQAGVIAPLLSVFGAAAVFVLLAACANVANLQLARSVARRGEIAVRMALGAGRWRIGRQLAVESLLLSAGGLGLSVWLVDIGLEGIRRSLPQGIAVWFAGWRNIGLHGPAFAFGASVALATTVLFGLLPLARLRRAGPGALDLRGRASSAFGRKGGLSGSLVVVQVSLALVLLAGAAATV